MGITPKLIWDLINVIITEKFILSILILVAFGYQIIPKTERSAL